MEYKPKEHKTGSVRAAKDKKDRKGEFEEGEGDGAEEVGNRRSGRSKEEEWGIAYEVNV